MKKLGVLIFLATLSLFLPTALVLAQTDQHDIAKRVILPEDEVIDHDYFAAGETVEIYGTINGDVYVAGGQLLIAGTINGDLLAAGGQISVTADIEQNARLVGGQISVEGNIGRNLSLAGGDIRVTSAALLAGNVAAGAGNLQLDADVPGNVNFAAGNAMLNNQIQGDVRAATGMLRLQPEAVISGDLIYWSDQDLILSGAATVAGELTRRAPPVVIEPDQNIPEQVKQGLAALVTTARLIGLLSAALIGYLLVHFFPNYSFRLISTIEERPGVSFIIGLITVILTPIVALISIFTVLFAPLGLLSLVLYGLILYFSKIFFAYWMGARILNRLEREASKTITFLIGLGVYHALSVIAFVGPITMIAATLFGTGAILLTHQRAYLSGRKLKIF